MSESKKNTACATVGCFAIVTPIVFMILIFAWAWPVGTVMDAGVWESDGDGSTFYFHDGMDWMGWAAGIFCLLVTVVLVQVFNSLFKVRLPANPSYREFPHANPNAQSWEEQFEQDLESFMFDYDSAKERELRGELTPLYVGGCLFYLVPVVACLLTYPLAGQLGEGPTLQRLGLLVVLCIVSFALILRGAIIKKNQPHIDDRAIIDFKKREIQRIALHDPFCKPEPWLSFNKFEHLLLTKGEYSSGEVKDSTIELVSPEQHLSLYTRSDGDWQEQAEYLAKKMGLTVVIEKQTRSSD